MTVIIAPATSSERDVIARLLEFNAYEFSRLDGRPINPDGRYGYAYVDAYWSEPGRFPYLMRVDQELAGFVLVSRVGDDWHISEFLVLPKFRGAGIGTQAAHQVFAAHPGSWQVRQVAHHDGATQFWRQAIPVRFSESIDDGGSITQTFMV